MSPSRRSLLRGGVFAATTALTTLIAQPARASQPEPADAVKAFRHGVASGDPLPDRVILWTRVTPTESALPGSGVGPAVGVKWEVSSDPEFRRIVARGTAGTGPSRDHTVKVDVSGLAPATDYWYRFAFRGERSCTGRTRTAPAAGAAVDRLRAGVVSCANLQAGWFSAYRHLAAQDIDLVIHLGDYLYEYGPGEYQAGDELVRPHEPRREILTLADYRQRHAQYKADPDLQALHARAAFVVTWDDHESSNDAYDSGAENHDPATEGEWTLRRRAAQRAYAEWMPVRYTEGGELYRRLDFGSLASLSMLDLRTYRSRQAAAYGLAEVADPLRTITGDPQMAFLKSSLSASEVQWKLVGNPVMIAPVRFPSTLDTGQTDILVELLGGTRIDGVPYNVDQWDGYTADRNEVLAHLRDGGITDTVFLTGDIHSAWACELPSEPLTYPVTRESLAVELVCTSVTSDNVDDIAGAPPHTVSTAVEAGVIANNPHIKHMDLDSHGFSVLEVTREAVRMEWHVISDRTDPRATASRSAAVRVKAGTQRVTVESGSLV